jgi:hypothetical protein
MRSSHSSVFALMLACGQVLAQGAPTPISAVPAPASLSQADSGGLESRTERIQVEDDSARIDELRIGGETRSISVTPKGGMPAYNVAPKTGERTWKVLGF